MLSATMTIVQDTALNLILMAAISIQPTTMIYSSRTEFVTDLRRVDTASLGLRWRCIEVLTDTQGCCLCVVYDDVGYIQKGVRDQGRC